MSRAGPRVAVAAVVLISGVAVARAGAEIVSRTGIKERRVVSGDESVADLAIGAAKEALASAGMQGEEIQLIIAATSTPDTIYPAVSCQVQEAIGAKGDRAQPVWLALGPGRRLPAALFDAAVRRTRAAGDIEVVQLAEADRAFEPRRLACPAPPELLRPWTS